MKNKLRSLSAKLRKDVEIEDRDEDEDDFEVEDCCMPCVTMFDVDLPRENPVGIR